MVDCIPGSPATARPSSIANGVGVCEGQTVKFAISDGEVSFDAFARLFRDSLKCDNALFLDGGSVPSLYAPSLNRGSNLLSIGPMIGVYDKASWLRPELGASWGRTVASSDALRTAPTRRCWLQVGTPRQAREAIKDTPVTVKTGES